MKFCPNCGAKVDPKSKFCTSCGAKLEKDQTVKDQPNNVQSHQTVKFVANGSDKRDGFSFKKIDSKKKKMIIGVFAILIILAGGFFAYRNHKKQTNVFNGVRVNFVGYNGVGKAEIDKKSKAYLLGNVFCDVAKHSGYSNSDVNKLRSIFQSLAESSMMGTEDENYNKKMNEVMKIEKSGGKEKAQKLEKEMSDVANMLDNFENGSIYITPNKNLKNGDKVRLNFSDPDVGKKLHDKYGINSEPVTFKVKGLDEE